MSEENQTIIITDYKNKTISIIKDKNNTSTYNLSIIPQKNADFIMNLQNDITQSLQINSIVNNIDNCAGLMFVAYNALSGTKLQSKMSGLQKSLLDLCDESIIAITNFKGNSYESAQCVIKAYDWLTRGKETAAMKQFKRCSEYANKMADKANELADGFEKIGQKSEEVLESTQDEQALKYEKMQKIQEDLNKYKAQIDKQKVNQEELNKSIEDINNEYSEAKKKEKNALDRKHGFEIAELVTDIIGGVVDMATPNLGKLGSVSSDNDKTSQVLHEKLEMEQQELEKCNKELSENNEKKAELEEKKKKLEAKIADEQQQLKKAEEDKNSGKSTESLIASLTSAINMDNESLMSCTSEIGLVVEAIKIGSEKMKSLKASIDSIGKQCGKISDAAAEELKNATEEKQKILDKKIQLEKERRDTLSQIAEFTSLIESSGKEKDTAATAIQTLQVAVKCIKQIVTSLSTAALFWRSMAKFCDKLADSAVIKNVEDVIEACDEQERIDYYFDDTFMQLMLQYIGQWTALYYVCEEYLNETRRVRSKVTSNIEKAPSIQEGLEAAPGLAEEMGDVVKKQIDNQDRLIKSLENGEAV